MSRAASRGPHSAATRGRSTRRSLPPATQPPSRAGPVPRRAGAKTVAARAGRLGRLRQARDALVARQGSRLRFRLRWPARRFRRPTRRRPAACRDRRAATAILAAIRAVCLLRRRPAPGHRQQRQHGPRLERRRAATRQDASRAWRPRAGRGLHARWPRRRIAGLSPADTTSRSRFWDLHRYEEMRIIQARGGRRAAASRSWARRTRPTASRSSRPAATARPGLWDRDGQLPPSNSARATNTWPRPPFSIPIGDDC